MVTGEGDYSQRLLAEYTDFLPQVEMMPQLLPQDVERFVSLGEEGRKRLRSGDYKGAEAAFRAQVAIFPPNPEPHVSLAILAATRGSRKAALEHLRAAVVRGFTDLLRVERAEGWIGLRSHPNFLALQDAIPKLLEAERKWGGWESFRASRPPDDLAAALRAHTLWRGVLEGMASALGPRLLRLWNRVNDRATAALLEAYVDERPQAPDLGDALQRLMALYSEGPLFRWEILPPASARRLAAVARTVLDRFPGSPMRPGALACRAVTAFASRDRRGALQPEAVEEIRASLGEILTHHAGSPFVAAAVEGLVRTEVEVGRMDLAAEAYRRFRDGHAGNRALQEQVRERLGELTLRAGGLPEFRATALDGGSVEREALRGKVVVVDFWATWCGPCIEQLPSLRRIAERHRDRVLVLGVSLDLAEDVSAQDLRGWIARENVPGRQLYDGLGWDSELVRAFGVKEIPFSVVVGADGAVLAVAKQGRGLENAVRAALE